MESDITVNTKGKHVMARKDSQQKEKLPNLLSHMPAVTLALPCLKGCSNASTSRPHVSIAAASGRKEVEKHPSLPMLKSSGYFRPVECNAFQRSAPRHGARHTAVTATENEPGTQMRSRRRHCHPYYADPREEQQGRHPPR